MSSSFTTLWSRDRYEAARRNAGGLFRFTVLFGGPHVSLPSFARAGAKPEDWIFPITIRDRAMFVLGRMQIARIVSVEAFRCARPEESEQVGQFDLALRFDNRPDEGLWNSFLAPSCVSEVVLGASGTPLLSAAEVPPDVVRQLRYRSQRGERAVKHVDADGRIMSLSSFQGVYRLTDASGELLASIVDRALAVA